MKCKVCDQGSFEVFFEAPQVPVFCNVLHDSEEAGRAAARGDLKLGYCRDCGMIYNVAFEPALVEYAVGYENSLHCSPRFQTFAEELADRLIEKYDLRDVDIFEIGSGRGEFLQLLCDGGNNRGLGYDPSAPDEDTDVPGRAFRIVQELFDPDRTEVAGRIICSRHVLEHIDEPQAFAAMLGRTRERFPDIDVYIEVPNALWTLRDLGVWDIIYEHCGYFTPPSMRALLAGGGLDKVSIREEFGGQFLSAETEANSPSEGDSITVARLTEMVDAFSDRYRQEIDRWNTELSDAVQSGRRFAIWGGGSKGVTFLNTVQHPEAIAAVVDINPRKHGKFVPGTGHPVVDKTAIADMGVDTVVVMNPLYIDEIRADLESLQFKGVVRTIDSQPAVSS